MKAQIKIILIAILLTLTANADWKPLKSLDHYGPKSFTLKKGVAYVEIRKFTKRDYGGDKVFKEQAVVLQIYQQISLSTEINKIPIKKNFAFMKGSRGGPAGFTSWYYNGYMIDGARKSWRLENIQDVIEMVKPIDTPAEIRLTLWLHGNADGNVDKYSAKYRKSGSGYVVKEHYISNGDAVYGCGDFTYQYKISSSGKITQKKLIKKRKVPCGAD